MISLNSSDVVERSVAETRDDNEEEDDKVLDEDGEEVEWVVNKSNSFIAAALAAAAWTSRGLRETGRGSDPESSGKLSMTELPLMLNAATS